MNLRQLQIFTLVTELNSMSETARQLYMTQPAVSQTVAELEEELKVKLFDRINRRLPLTDAGETLYAYATRILQLVDEAKGTIKDLANLRAGKLRLGASTTIGTYLIPAIVSQFERDFSGIHTSFTINNTGIIEKLVLDNSVDLGLVEGLVHSADVKVIHFLKDELYLTCSTKHPWATRPLRVIDPEELKNACLILREEGSGTREVVESSLGKHGFSYSVTHVLNNTEAIKKAVEANLGVAFISKLAVRDEIEAGRLVRIKLENLPLTRELNVIYHKDKYRSPLFTAFLSHLEHIRSNYM